MSVGIENFEEIRREGFYYVDKTGLICDLLISWGKVNLFTRPRRFGKTLNMSMFKSFFEIRADKTLFDGLTIHEETQLCEKYIRRFLDEQETLEDVHESLKMLSRLLCSLFEQALKTNDFLYFAVQTGCLRISKESIFTGLNNLKVLSIADTRIDEHFGFTDA